MRVAAVAFPLRPFRDFAEFAAVFRSQAKKAAAAGAWLVVFPEYVAGGLQGIDRRWSVWEEPLLALARAVASELKLFVLAGTHPWRDGRRLVNRAHLVAPDGRMVVQDKLHLTPWEKTWKLSPGRTLTPIDLPGVRVAILTCYDVEFPAACRAAARAGADLLLVPSWTDDRQGHCRVRYCAHARTVEQQLFVVHAPLVGGTPKVFGFEQASGRPGVLTPCDTDFARDGIAGEGAWDRPGVVVADLDLARLARIRKAGSVTPRIDAKPEHAYRVVRARRLGKKA